LTLGHEVAGTVAALGDGVAGFAVGDRVAVGWFGGNCNHCIPCRKGKFMQCENGQVPSWHYPGGYAESVTVPATALACAEAIAGTESSETAATIASRISLPPSAPPWDRS
jgi:D-arabinose 1-dehydrogenase-like Zn-dependent alcohol dehydrogenase